VAYFFGPSCIVNSSQRFYKGRINCWKTICRYRLQQVKQQCFSRTFELLMDEVTCWSSGGSRHFERGRKTIWMGARVRRKAPEFFIVVPLHFLALFQVQSVVLMSAFVMVSTV